VSATVIFGWFAVLYLMNRLVNALYAAVEGWTAEQRVHQAFLEVVLVMVVVPERRKKTDLDLPQPTHHEEGWECLDFRELTVVACGVGTMESFWELNLL